MTTPLRSFARFDKDNHQAGMLSPSSVGWTYGTLTLVANQARISRFVPSRDMTIVSIAFGVTTAAGADDACDVGIYDSSLSKIVSAGATTGKLNSTGVKTVSITSTIVRRGRVYYAAFSCGTLGGTAGVVASATFNNVQAAQLFGNTAGKLEADSIATAHPLPSTLTPSATGGSCPALALRES